MSVIELSWTAKKAVSLFWAIIWGFKKVDLLCCTLFWVGLLFIVKVLRNLYESYSKTTEKDHFEWEPLHTAEDLVYTWELMSRNEKIERKAWQKNQLLCRQRHSASALFVQLHQCHNPPPPILPLKLFHLYLTEVTKELFHHKGGSPEWKNVTCANMQSFIEKKTGMEEFIWKLKSSHSMGVNNTSPFISICDGIFLANTGN